MSLYMCEACFKGGTEIGEIAPGFALVLYKDTYYVLEGPSHMEDVLYTFPEKPFPDPPDEDIAATQKWIDLMDVVDKGLQGPPEYMYRLMKACIEVGFKDDKLLSAWLLDRCGQLVEIHEGIRPSFVQPTKNPSSGWNYRIIVEDQKSPIQIEGRCMDSKLFSVYEVYYGEDGKPHSTTAEPVYSAESLVELKGELTAMLKALDKPVFQTRETEDKKLIFTEVGNVKCQTSPSDPA